MLSVFASPSVILPSQVIAPVACKLPFTVVLLFNLIVPVPLAVILILSLEMVFCNVLLKKFKLVALILGTTITGLTD